MPMGMMKMRHRPMPYNGTTGVMLVGQTARPMHPRLVDMTRMMMNHHSDTV